MRSDPGVVAWQVIPPDLEFTAPLRWEAPIIGQPSRGSLLVFHARETDPAWTLVGPAPFDPNTPRRAPDRHLILIDRPGLWTVARFHAEGVPDAGR